MYFVFISFYVCGVYRVCRWMYGVCVCVCTVYPSIEFSLLYTLNRIIARRWFIHCALSSHNRTTEPDISWFVCDSKRCALFSLLITLRKQKNKRLMFFFFGILLLFSFLLFHYMRACVISSVWFVCPTQHRLATTMYYIFYLYQCNRYGAHTRTHTDTETQWLDDIPSLWKAKEIKTRFFRV